MRHDMADLSSEQSIDQHIQHCRSLLGAFALAVKQRQWAMIPEHEQQFSHAMAQLRSAMDRDEQAVTVYATDIRDLEIRVRRLQRQLTTQMQQLESDISFLAQAVRRGEASLHFIHTLAE